MKSRISSWNKWDLHIHTRASKIKKGNNEYFGEGVSFTDAEIKDFVNHIFPDSKPKLVAITDHDYFDNQQFLKIKKEVEEYSEIKDSQFCVLPGVECDIFFKLNENNEVIIEDDARQFKHSKRTHIVLIFNDIDWGDERYLELHNLIEEKYRDDSPIWINELLQKFAQNKFEFIAIPHFSKENGIEDSVPDNVDGARCEHNMEEKVNWILSGYFPLLDAASSDFTNMKVVEFYKQLSNKHGFKIPEVLTSDNHDYRNYNKDLNLSWYKATPSFKGLKMCCSDYDMRVKLEPDAPRSIFISKILITGDDEYVEKKEMELSENLNCLIGGRSSGKSLLLKQIVKASGSSDADNELLRYKKYDGKFSVSLIGNDGKVYKGKPEYISQGSIIEKYINNTSNSNLANDFKEYFPKNVDFESIEKDKENIKTTLSNLDNGLERLSTSSKELLSKNFNDYLSISKIKYENKISNKTLLAEFDYGYKTVNNLKQFIEILETNKQLIEPYKKLYSDLCNLIEKFKKQLELSLKRIKIYELIKKASTALIFHLDSTAEGYDKKQKTQAAAIGSLSNQVYEWWRTYSSVNKHIKSLKQTVDSLKETQTFQNDIPSFKFSIKITNNLTITELFKVVLERVKDKEIRESTKNFFQLADKVLTHPYETYVSKNLKTMIDSKLDESYKIEYLIYEKGELINSMSEGRKVSVFMNILLNRTDSIEPLIIDQPEDDMDNSDIYEILVKSLRSRKAGRQIILATHDSNIVVNGDAENVIYASKKNKKTKISYDYGSLEYEDENINIQKLICDTLEGGEQAFINRAYKYDLNKTKIYKWESVK